MGKTVSNLQFAWFKLDSIQEEVVSVTSSSPNWFFAHKKHLFWTNKLRLKLGNHMKHHLLYKKCRHLFFRFHESILSDSRWSENIARRALAQIPPGPKFPWARNNGEALNAYHDGHEVNGDLSQIVSPWQFCVFVTFLGWWKTWPFHWLLVKGDLQRGIPNLRFGVSLAT